MTRVLHVINSLGIGGAETMLTRLLLQAPQPGIQAEVAVLLPGGGLTEKLRAGGIAVHEFDLRRGPLALLGLANLIRAREPDVVQSWMYYADLAALAALALSGRRKRTRLIWGIRCSDMRLDLYGWPLRLAVRLGALFSGAPDIVSVNSQAGQRVHTALGYRPKRWAFVPNGIDTARFRPDAAKREAIRAELGIAEETPVIACLARNDAMKDYPTFLAMLDRLPAVTAIAAGTGTEALPAHPRLKRLGRRDDAEALLAAADLYVSASAFGEGFSNSIGEAMAAGLPVVATDVGDARLIVGEAGRIVPPGDPGALTAAAIDILSENREIIGRLARERMETHFTLSQAAASFVALYA